MDRNGVRFSGKFIVEKSYKNEGKEEGGARDGEVNWKIWELKASIVWKEGGKKINTFIEKGVCEKVEGKERVIREDNNRRGKNIHGLEES